MKTPRSELRTYHLKYAAFYCLEEAYFPLSLALFSYPSRNSLQGLPSFQATAIAEISAKQGQHSLIRGEKRSRQTGINSKDRKVHRMVHFNSALYHASGIDKGHRTRLLNVSFPEGI